MANEREGVSSDFVLRTHHLGMLEDVSREFLEYSGGLRPWEFPQEKFYKLIQFAKDFAVKETEKDAKMRSHFENSIIDSETADKDYAWLIDSIGTDKDSYQKTLDGRTNFYVQLFQVLSNKNNKIFLSNAPDDYCKACAIGNHCLKTKPDPDELDMDSLYMEALRKLMTTNETLIGETSDGRTYIRAAFFNSYFIAALESRLKELITRLKC